MDFDKCNAPKAVSVLQGDGFYFDRAILRKSPEVHSSWTYYRSSEGTVPFQWEKQPGTPKHPPENDIIVPPLNPPPVVQSSGLPQRRPCADWPKDSNRWWWTRFWKRSKKDRRDEKYTRTRRSKKDLANLKASNFPNVKENFSL